ncbi:hypothetical protein AB7M49_003837 [Bradyrhizobium elkanii]
MNCGYTGACGEGSGERRVVRSYGTFILNSLYSLADWLASSDAGLEAFRKILAPDADKRQICFGPFQVRALVRQKQHRKPAIYPTISPHAKAPSAFISPAVGGQGVEDDLRWIAANVSTAYRVSCRQIDPASIYNSARPALSEVPEATYSSGLPIGGTNSSERNGIPRRHSPEVTMRRCVLYSASNAHLVSEQSASLRGGSRSDIHQLA